jgi:hypothetical protein
MKAAGDRIAKDWDSIQPPGHTNGMCPLKPRSPELQQNRGPTAIHGSRFTPRMKAASGIAARAAKAIR